MCFITGANFGTNSAEHFMTLSNWNTFSVTGPLWGESTCHRWIPSPRPVTRCFGVFFDLRLNKRLSKQSRRRWFETHHAHYDVITMYFAWRAERPTTGTHDLIKIGNHQTYTGVGLESHIKRIWLIKSDFWLGCYAKLCFDSHDFC